MAKRDPRKLNVVVMFKPRPIDRELIEFLRSKSTMTISNVIREALAYRAESLGLNLSELMKRLETSRKKDLERELREQREEAEEAKKEAYGSTPA